jgi:hypothetical protein
MNDWNCKSEELHLLIKPIHAGSFTRLQRILVLLNQYSQFLGKWIIPFKLGSRYLNSYFMSVPINETGLKLYFEFEE